MDMGGDTSKQDPLMFDSTPPPISSRESAPPKSFESVPLEDAEVLNGKPPYYSRFDNLMISV